MSRPRTELSAMLHRICDNVYFQPPDKTRMQYPCIIYELDSIRTTHADNANYSSMKGYAVTVIDRNPDSEIPDAVAELQYCSFDRRYTADNLYHTVFNLYF